MNDLPASIAIFHREIESPEVTRPITPSEVFEAAKRVVNNKNVEVIKCRNGVYVVSYSETGPFQDDVVAQDWMPVHIMKLTKWHSGGIQERELATYEGYSHSSLHSP